MTSTGTPAAYWSALCTGDGAACRRHSARLGACRSGRGQDARSGTGIRSPAASIVPAGAGMSLWCWMCPGGDVLERSGTFHAAGCVSSLAGTGRAFGDRNPAPDGVECPRLYRNVPDGAGCPRLWRQTVLDTTRPRRRAGCAPSPSPSRTSTTPPEAGNVQNGDKGRDEAENKERKPHDSAVQVMVRASGYPLCHRFGHAAGRTGSRSRAGAGGWARCRC